jgi:uncharacterized C2H2 Zn-finger protein
MKNEKISQISVQQEYDLYDLTRQMADLNLWDSTPPVKTQDFGSEEGGFDTEISAEDGPSNFFCNTCGISYHDKRSYQMHLKITHAIPQNNTCRRSFRRHVHQAHKMRVKRPKTSQMKEVSIMGGQHLLRKEFNENTKSKFVCKSPRQLKFSSELAYLDHLKFIHPDKCQFKKEKRTVTVANNTNLSSKIRKACFNSQFLVADHFLRHASSSISPKLYEENDLGLEEGPSGKKNRQLLLKEEENDNNNSSQFQETMLYQPRREEETTNNSMQQEKDDHKEEEKEMTMRVLYSASFYFSCIIS